MRSAAQRWIRLTCTRAARHRPALHARYLKQPYLNAFPSSATNTGFLVLRPGAAGPVLRMVRTGEPLHRSSSVRAKLVHDDMPPHPLALAHGRGAVDQHQRGLCRRWARVAGDLVQMSDQHSRVCRQLRSSAIRAHLRGRQAHQSRLRRVLLNSVPNSQNFLFHLSVLLPFLQRFFCVFFVCFCAVDTGAAGKVRGPAVAWHHACPADVTGAAFSPDRFVLLY
jgi:hypothetical protein